MSVVADTTDGDEMIRQLRHFDNIVVTSFGRLHFKLDVSNLAPRDAWELVDQLNDSDPCVSTFVDVDCTLDFDYFITEDLLPYFRAIVDEYTNSYYGGKLLAWEFTKHDS